MEYETRVTVEPYGGLVIPARSPLVLHLSTIRFPHVPACKLRETLLSPENLFNYSEYTQYLAD